MPGTRGRSGNKQIIGGSRGLGIQLRPRNATNIYTTTTQSAAPHAPAGRSPWRQAGDPSRGRSTLRGPGPESGRRRGSRPAVLPHHRTCGSVYGGSADTCQFSRVVDEAHETQPSEGTIRDRLAHVARATVPPGTSAIHRAGPGPLGVQTTAGELSGSCPGTLPLTPQNDAQSVANPDIEILEDLPHLAIFSRLSTSSIVTGIGCLAGSSHADADCRARERRPAAPARRSGTLA